MRLNLAMLLLAVACSPPPAALTAPDGLSYPDAPFALKIGTALPEAKPTLSGGGAVSEFMISKALPPGLSFDTATGGIKGTPTAAANKSLYTVVASNAAGTASTNIELRVDAVGVAPTNLVYPVTDVSYLRNQAIAANTPAVEGTTPISFSVSPALPAGLSLSSTTGSITGTPTVAAAKADFVVTAANVLGNTTTTLHIGVVDQATPPVITGYTAAMATYVVNTAIVKNSPTLSGTPPFTFSVDKALPAGLSFNTSDGSITGTPTAASARADYVVTAMNSAGSSMFTVSIRVVQTASFAYPTTHFQFLTPGSGITPIAPTSLPTGIDPLAIAPTLPQGLTFDTATGVVRGAPIRATALGDTVFTVTATDTVSRETVTATFNLELRSPMEPAPGATAGVWAQGILVDVSNSYDGVNCTTGGASLAPSSGTISAGQSITFRLATAPTHAWSDVISQTNAGNDAWPSLPCLTLANQGSTCTLGVNHGAVTYTFQNSHTLGQCPDPGSVTVN